jgi:hypothetical protein
MLETSLLHLKLRHAMIAASQDDRGAGYASSRRPWIYLAPSYKTPHSFCITALSCT